MHAEGLGEAVLGGMVMGSVDRTGRLVVGSHLLPAVHGDGAG